MAAQQARLLKQLLKERATKADPLSGLPLDVLFREPAAGRGAVEHVGGPGSGLSGRSPANARQISRASLKYNGALLRIAMRDATVHRLLAEVQQLLKPPSVPQDPAVDRLVQSELVQMAAE